MRKKKKREEERVKDETKQKTKAVRNTGRVDDTYIIQVSVQDRVRKSKCARETDRG